MAWWAELMFYATAATVVLTLAALFAIIRTLHHTRRAADSAELVAADTRSIGQAQVRAYLDCTGASFEITKGGFSATLQIENAGQSPARNVTISGSCTISDVGGHAHSPRVLHSVTSSEADMQVDPIAAQSLKEGTIVFLEAFNFPVLEDPEAAKIIRDLSQFGNAISFDISITWIDVFKEHHRVDLRMDAYIDISPYDLSIKSRKKSGNLSFFVDWEKHGEG